MSERREVFLAGERPDDVALYLSASFIDDPSALADHGELVDDGVLLVVDGEAGREVFQQATGSEAMAFTKEAMTPERPIDGDLTGGECPNAGDGGDHEALYVFAFAEAENQEVGGIYAEGDVMHAYAQCECGESYSDRWVVEE